MSDEKAFDTPHVDKLVLGLCGLMFLGVVYGSILERSVGSVLGESTAQTILAVQEDGSPNETRPDPGMLYEVPANQPRRIIIPSLGVDGFVQAVGLTDENAIDVPSNIHVAGWYNGSAEVGQDGLSIIDGHVSGYYSDGIFVRLAELKVGENFQIEMGDSSIIVFEVTDSRDVSAEEANNALFEATNDRQLNLITCSGEFDDNSESYANRHIVFASRVQ